MENTKVYDSLKEACAYKPIWPDYDLQYNNLKLGIRSYIRKQDNKGIWRLIPVIMTYEFTKDIEKNENDIVKSILDNVKRFKEQCYRTLLLFKFPEEPMVVHGVFIDGEVDPNQESEKERLLPKLN